MVFMKLSRRSTNNQTEGHLETDALLLSEKGSEDMEKNEGSFAMKIGNVLYYVSVRPSENAKETLDAKLRKAITKEVLSPSFGREMPATT